MRKVNGTSSDSDYGARSAAKTPMVEPQPSTRRLTADSSLEFGVEPPTESCAELAMRSRIAARLNFDIGEPIQKIGRYEVVRRLGAGGMGVVYEARDPQLDRSIALKVLRAHLATSFDGYNRLRQEARALAKLSHPNVVQIHEVAEHEGTSFVAMELVRGETLHTWQKSKRTLTEILTVYREAGLGLAAAHQAGIVHRDFKPSNVLIGDDGRIRVADFGLAYSRADTIDDATELGLDTGQSIPTVAGTPGYMAPEVLAGSQAGAASDQFSFCVSVWEAISGERPTAIPTDGRAHSKPSFPGPAWLRRVLVRGLAEAPTDRWPDLPSLLLTFDRRPRRQRRLLLALPLLGLGAGLLAPFMSAKSGDPCAELGRDFDSVWNPDAADRLRGQLVALGRTTAETELVIRRLDRQRALWLESEREVCEATHVEVAWSLGLQDAANRCLTDTLAQSGDLIALFDVPVVDAPASIQTLLAELDDPRHCADVDALGRSPTPESVAAATLDRAIARAWLWMTAETPPVDVESERLLVEARALGRAEPDDLGAELVLAEALELRAAVEQWRQRPDLAWPLLREAIPIARRHSAVDLELRCLQRMSVIAANQLEDPDRGADFVALAEGVIALSGAGPRAAFEHELARAQIARARQAFGDAETILRAAIDEATLADEVDRASLFRARLSLANLVAEQGQLAVALPIYADLREAMAIELGPDSADVGLVETNIGQTLYEAGDREPEAELHLWRAVDLLERSLGVHSIRLAAPLTLLAEIEYIDGRLADAKRDAERAWALQRDQLPARHGDRGEPLKVLAGVQLAEHDFEGALASYELMAEVLSTDSDHERAGIACSRGWLLCRLDRCESARPLFDAALALQTSDAIRACGVTGLANADIVAGHPGSALVRLSEFSARVEAGAFDDPAQSAEIEWLTARALADSDAKPAAVCEHVRRARAFAADQSLAKDIVADLDALERGCSR